MTLVKICGITNLADAVAAVDAGADALGFNFYRPSSRYIEPSFAREIIEQLPEPVLTVGVFVNEDNPETVRTIAVKAGIRALQLHGDESIEYCAALNDLYIIKAFAVREDFDERKVLDYPVQAIMLDASDNKLRGGTGQVIDWSIAKRVNELGLRMYLAGGLSPENVKQAIAYVKPHAVDACSALEKAPGRKDLDRMRAFLKAAHE